MLYLRHHACHVLADDHSQTTVPLVRCLEDGIPTILRWAPMSPCVVKVQSQVADSKIRTRALPDLQPALPYLLTIPPGVPVCQQGCNGGICSTSYVVEVISQYRVSTVCDSQPNYQVVM